jgi:predicted phage tail protein
MKRKVFLYGELAEKHGRMYELDVESVGEAVRALDCMLGGFVKSIRKDGHYRVVRGEDIETGEGLGEDQLQMQFGRGDFHIMPVLEGSKNSGIFQVVLGVAMIAAAVWLGPESAYFGALLIGGIAATLGGVATMLTPVPKTDSYSEREKPDERPSHIFDGPINVYEQGGPVPLVLGKRVLCGSVTISSGLDVVDIL